MLTSKVVPLTPAIGRSAWLETVELFGRAIQLVTLNRKILRNSEDGDKDAEMGNSVTVARVTLNHLV